MKKLLVLLTAAVFVLSACQKEPEFIDTATSGNNPTAAGRLVRQVFLDGADSTVRSLAYDGAGRLVFYRVTDGVDSVDVRLVRNANGIVTQVVQKGTNLLQPGLDSIRVNVFYNATTSRYTHTRNEINLGGVLISDSSVFSYDAAGNPGSFTSYALVPGFGFVPYVRRDFTFTAGNLATQKLYDLSAGTAELRQTFTYAHDTKVNPLQLGVESILLDEVDLFGANNVVSEQVVHASTPADDYSLATTYNYNTANKPVTATMVETPGAYTYQYRFYYN